MLRSFRRSSPIMRQVDGTFSFTSAGKSSG
jgi:hypothetical protein